MDIALWILFATLFLAFANGANDNFKGVATLYGSRTLSKRAALIWATITTLAGSLTAAWFATELAKLFSGKGLVPDALVGEPTFMLAVALGAAITVFVAARLGIPVSTTHALVGGLCGAALLAAGVGGIDWTTMTRKVLLSLAFGPILSLALLYAVAPAVSGASKFLKHYCFCYNGRGISLASGVASIRAVEDVRVGEGRDCAAAAPLSRHVSLSGSCCSM